MHFREFSAADELEDLEFAFATGAHARAQVVELRDGRPAARVDLNNDEHDR